jgi:hypothetical protein
MPAPAPESPTVMGSDAAAASRKLIKSASLNIETKEFDDAVSAVETLCLDFGGYIESSNVYGGDKRVYSSYSYNQRSAYYTLRVPENGYDAFLQQVGSIGNVTQKSQNAQDVTDAYFDTASRLKAVETRRDRLLSLLEKADTMETIIQLERELSNTIYEIDSYSGTLKKYDNQVDFSYVSINLTEVVELTPEVTPPPDTLGGQIKDAGSAAWRGLTSGVKLFIIWFVRNVFSLIILVAIAVAAILIFRKKNRKKIKPNDSGTDTEQK